MMWKQHWYWIGMSGLSLGAFFICWVYSLTMTTVAHSLLFSNLDSIILIIGASIKNRSANLGLFFGAIVALSGICAISFNSSNDITQGSIFGDIVALLSSFMIVGYILIGKMMRDQQDAPLFNYVFGIYFVAWLFSYIISIIFELEYAGEIFGWCRLEILPYTLWLGIIPGFAGQTIILFVIKYLSSITVSIFGQLEPVLGTIIAWIFGYQKVPATATWIGACLIIAGCIIVVFSEHMQVLKKEKEDGDSELSTPYTPLR